MLNSAGLITPLTIFYNGHLSCSALQWNIVRRICLLEVKEKYIFCLLALSFSRALRFTCSFCFQQHGLIDIFPEASHQR